MNTNVATKQDLQELQKGLRTELTAVVNNSVSNAIDQLGRMIKVGFDDMSGEFKDVRTQITGLDTHLGNVELRLDQAAYRFEMVELERRVLDVGSISA